MGRGRVFWKKGIGMERIIKGQKDDSLKTLTNVGTTTK